MSNQTLHLLLSGDTSFDASLCTTLTNINHIFVKVEGLRDLLKLNNGDRILKWSVSLLQKTKAVLLWAGIAWEEKAFLSVWSKTLVATLRHRMGCVLHYSFYHLSSTPAQGDINEKAHCSTFCWGLYFLQAFSWSSGEKLWISSLLLQWHVMPDLWKLSSLCVSLSLCFCGWCFKPALISATQ